MKKIGISTSNIQCKYTEKGSIDIAKNVGAEYVDFYTDYFSVANPETVYAKSDEEIIEYFSGLKEYANERGISFYQTHGRRRIYLNDADADRVCMENARRDLLAASALGAKVCVMHGVTTSTMGADVNPQLMRDINYDTFLKILPWAKKYDVILAMETFGFCPKYNCPEFFASAEEFKNSYERIAAVEEYAEHFKVCVDSGHCNTVTRFGNPQPSEVIKSFGKNVACIHLHDNDGFYDQHLPLYSGTIKWDDVFEALESIGFEGVYNLELNLRRYGSGFEKEAAEFGVKLLKFALGKR